MTDQVGLQQKADSRKKKKFHPKKTRRFSLVFFSLEGACGGALTFQSASSSSMAARFNNLPPPPSLLLVTWQVTVVDVKPVARAEGAWLVRARKLALNETAAKN